MRERLEALTPDELLQAREFAGRFTQRLHETGDLTQLAGEFSLSDFGAQLRPLERIPP